MTHVEAMSPPSSNNIVSLYDAAGVYHFKRLVGGNIGPPPAVFKDNAAPL